MFRIALLAPVVCWCALGSVMASQPLDGTPHATAESLIEHGESRLAQDQFGAAREAFMEARRMLSEEPDAALEWAAVTGLADIEIKEGNYAAATGLLDEAEQLWRREEDPAFGARLWTLRAGVAFRQRRTGEALQHRLRAAEYARLASDPRLLFQALTNLARAYLDVHDYAAAIPLFSETATLAGEPLDQVVNLIQLGISQIELNQFDGARRSFESARKAASQLGSPRLEGTAIGELGLVAWGESRAADQASAYFEEAIEKLTAIGDRVNAVVWRTNQALVLRETGRFEEALSLYEALEAELESIEGQQVWPTIYKGMAQSQLGLDRLGEARRTIDRCLEAAQRGGDSKRIWECQQLRGRLAARTGNMEQALEAYEAALAEIERARVALLVGRFKADFFENKLAVYQEYAALLAGNLPELEAARATFAISERARARAFLDELAQSNEATREGVPEDLLQREEALLQAIRNLRLEGETDASNAAEIARLEGELDGLALSARRQLALLPGHSRPNSLEEIQAALAPGEVMLVYWLAEPASHLWRIDGEGIERHELPPAREIEVAVRAAYGGLTDPASAFDFTRLSRMLLGHLLQNGMPDGPLLIVPSGILYYFPFDVLQSREDSPPFDRVATSYLPSASALVHLRQIQPRSRPPALLAVGDLPYPATPGSARQPVAADYGPLPFSGPEVRAARDRFGVRSANLMTGEAVTERDVKSLPLEAYSVLHFATHGWIDPASQNASGLLLISGSASEDGLLQVREIRRLNLDAELVILSACQSALGRLVTGEGMVGLTRAFLDAGARSVVASLWNVNDQASADFMDAFYASLEQGAGRAEALGHARAKLRARPEYRHPYYWAAWVMTGDGRGEVDFPVRWERWVLLGLGLLLIAGLLGWWRVQSRN